MPFAFVCDGWHVYCEVIKVTSLHLFGVWDGRAGRGGGQDRKSKATLDLLSGWYLELVVHDNKPKELVMCAGVGPCGAIKVQHLLSFLSGWWGSQARCGSD